MDMVRPMCQSAEVLGSGSDALMSHPQLRLYFGPDDERDAKSPLPHKEIQNQVAVPLGQVLPLLADAVHTKRAWIRDFHDDKITISADLYEVLLAYQHLRPSA
jgi:hypothetical protein